MKTKWDVALKEKTSQILSDTFDCFWEDLRKKFTNFDLHIENFGLKTYFRIYENYFENAEGPLFCVTLDKLVKQFLKEYNYYWSEPDSEMIEYAELMACDFEKQAKRIRRHIAAVKKSKQPD